MVGSSSILQHTQRNLEYVQSLRLRRLSAAPDCVVTNTNMDDVGRSVTLIFDVICFHIFNDIFLLGCTSIFPVFQFAFFFFFCFFFLLH